MIALTFKCWQDLGAGQDRRRLSGEMEDLLSCSTGARSYLVVERQRERGYGYRGRGSAKRRSEQGIAVGQRIWCESRVTARSGRDSRWRERPGRMRWLSDVMRRGWGGIG